MNPRGQYRPELYHGYDVIGTNTLKRFFRYYTRLQEGSLLHLQLRTHLCHFATSMALAGSAFVVGRRAAAW